MVDTFNWSGKKNVPSDPKWNGINKRWQAYRTGDLYVLTIQNRTLDHTFKVHQYGKNAWQAGLRYYRGFQGDGKAKRDSWVWKCTKIVNASLFQPDEKLHKKVLTK